MPKVRYTPCIKVCKYDDEGYCLGCSRTKEEVQGWRNRTEKEQLDGIEMLKERSIHLTPRDVLIAPKLYDSALKFVI